MPYVVEFKPSARKAMDGLPESIFRRAEPAITALAMNPRPRGAVQEIRFEPRFLELHHQIWASLREEVEAAYARAARGGRS